MINVILNDSLSLVYLLWLNKPDCAFQLRVAHTIYTHVYTVSQNIKEVFDFVIFQNGNNVGFNNKNNPLMASPGSETCDIIENVLLLATELLSLTSVQSFQIVVID